MNQVALTEADKKKLAGFSKGGRLNFYIFTGITLAGALASAIGFMTAQSGWPGIMIPFILLFVFGAFMSWRENNKVVLDIQGGMKEKVSGVITKKTISQGNQRIKYDMDTMHRIALRVEEEERGGPITRYGPLDAEIDSATRHWYGVEIDRKNYNIGIRYYLEVNEGEHVSLEVAPRSKRVLSMQKG